MSGTFRKGHNTTRSSRGQTPYNIERAIGEAQDHTIYATTLAEWKLAYHNAEDVQLEVWFFGGSALYRGTLPEMIAQARYEGIPLELVPELPFVRLPREEEDPK